MDTKPALALIIVEEFVGKAHGNLDRVKEMLTQEPLTEPDFYIGYRKRLKTKLNQKMTQIARTERLLETLPEEEKPSFQASLQMAISEREEIEKLLDQIREHFEKK